MNKLTVATIAFMFPFFINSPAIAQTQKIYDPQINPVNFTAEITNKYFTLKPGKKLIYEGQTEEGLERIEILITDETKNIMGVETLVYWDKVWLDDVLIEDTRDYLAQDKEGNVWYFGEDVDNYENGVLADHDGSWIAGVDGAKPGIWMEANPQVGDSYRQEYYKGEAEDMAEVLAINETVAVPYGTYTDCVKTYDWTPLDPTAKEHKYYCSEVGGLVLEVNLNNDEKVELVDLKTETVGETTPVEQIDEPEDNLVNNDPYVEDTANSLGSISVIAIILLLIGSVVGVYAFVKLRK